MPPRPHRGRQGAPRLLLLLLAAALAAPAGAGERWRWGDWRPRTKGYVEMMDRFEKQVMQMDSRQSRFDGLMQVAAGGFLTPNFTRVGWDVVAEPTGEHLAIWRELRERLHQGMRSARTEHKVDQIAGPLCKFVHADGALAQKALSRLQPMHEAWAGGERLVPNNAYGMRLYQPGNNLTMHLDKAPLGSHVISSILHVDRDVDEPWPIVIRGYDGKTVEVDLRPGQMLFYEASKCMHGRPRPLKGRWYASLFLHYRVASFHIDQKQVIDAVGDRHLERLKDDGSVPRLQVVGTGFLEPGCAHGWCELAPDWPRAASEAPAPDRGGLRPVSARAEL